MVIVGDDDDGEDDFRDDDGKDVSEVVVVDGVSGWLGGERVVGVVDEFGAGWLEDECADGVWKMSDDGIVCVDGHYSLLVAVLVMMILFFCDSWSACRGFF